MGIRNGRTCQTGDETHKEDTFMKTPGRHRIVVAAIIAALCLVPLPTVASADADRDMSGEDYWGTEYSVDLQADGLWIDGITHEMLFAAAPDTTIKAYVAQLDRVRAAYRSGDEGATRTAMNTLMVMLDNREYGIPAKTASMLFDYCNLVAPAKYHDVSRHQRADRGSDTAQSTVDTGGFDNGGGDSF